MRREILSLVLVLALASVASAVAPCSTGAQLYSNWQSWAAEVESLEESVIYHFEQFEQAAERQIEAQYMVAFHMGWCTCGSDPCPILLDLLDNLADKQDAVDCARDAWIEASDDLNQAKANRDGYEAAWLAHVDQPCNECDEWWDDPGL